MLKSKILVNAAGPWINEVLSNVIKLNSKKSIRLVKGSHIITKSLYRQKKAYTLQNEDNRIIFVIPYKDEYSLIGTTETEVFSPENPKMLKKFIYCTGITTVLFTLIYLLMKFEYLNLRNIIN